VQSWPLERLTECPSSQGIYITTAVNFVVENNTVVYATRNGIGYEGMDGIIRWNKVRNSGADILSIFKGIKVTGNDNLVDGNILQFVFAGIYQESGQRNTYTNNVLDHAFTAGIHIAFDSSDTLIVENTISNCQGDAIAITGGSLVVVRANVLTDNKNDLCNEQGMDADVTLQSALTTTTSCIHY
jgi:parallel beta-helix repeat protein